MAMCPQMQADNIHSFDGTDFVAREVHIERYISRGWARILYNRYIQKCRLLATILLQFPFFRRLLVTLALLGIPLEQE